MAEKKKRDEVERLKALAPKVRDEVLKYSNRSSG